MPGRMDGPATYFIFCCQHNAVSPQHFERVNLTATVSNVIDKWDLLWLI